MRNWIAIGLGLLLSLGLLPQARAQDPGSFLDLRISASPYFRWVRGDLQDVSWGLSLGLWQFGFIGFEMDRGLFDEEIDNAYRILAGIRGSGLRWQDEWGSGLAVGGSLGLGWSRIPTRDGDDGFCIRMGLHALYWMWRGRLGLGLELGGDVALLGGPGFHAAAVASLAFPWSEQEPTGLDDDWVNPRWLGLRVRISPFAKGGMPEFLGILGLDFSVSFWDHLVLDYTFDITGQAHTDSTFSHTIAVGGRIPAVVWRDEEGRGLQYDLTGLIGYSHYQYDEYEGDLRDRNALILRLDGDLLYWFSARHGAGLSLSFAYYRPYSSQGNALDDDHMGLGGAFVYSATF